MLRLPDDWIWDSWPFENDGRRHLFFLKAPRSLGDPNLRHFHASVGHAVGDDWRSWEVLPQALAPAAGPAWDDATTWTGSVVKGPTGRFHLFYTGTSHDDDRKVQRIGRADSDDLVHWERFDHAPVCEADPRWYEKYSPDIWHDEAWRDPWVFPDPDGAGWHMFVTARANHGDPLGRGVVGHAWSRDLDAWEVGPPLSSGGGFGQMEVLQWRPGVGSAGTLVFSCGPNEIDRTERSGREGGVFLVDAPSALGPFDIDSARRLDHPSLYAARLVTDVDGQTRALGFSGDVAGRFVGEILDPVDLVLNETSGGRPVPPHP